MRARRGQQQEDKRRSPRYVPTTQRSTRRWGKALMITTASVMLTILATFAILFLLVDARRVEIQLDIVKIALAAGAGAGGLVTLMMGVRRQLLAEQTADEARHDANERRVIDLYARGVEQLGSDQTAVRVGGLYALERLADSNPDLREQVVDIVCVLLKGVSDTDRSQALLPEDMQRACLSLLHDHLAHESPYAVHKNYWNVGLMSLAGARLEYASFSAAKVDTMHFSETYVDSRANFDGAHILGANFTSATFQGAATFVDATLGKGVFKDAKFRGQADFTRATFTIYADFAGATFMEPPDFTGARVAATETARTKPPPGWQTAPTADPAWLSIIPGPTSPPPLVERRPRWKPRWTQWPLRKGLAVTPETGSEPR